MNWEEIKSLLSTLVERSKTGSVNWQQTRNVEDPNKVVTGIDYMVQLPEAALFVGSHWPPKGQETVRIRLSRADGIGIFDRSAVKESENWELFKDLLDAAENTVVPGKGNLMQELLNSVRDSVKVGLTVEDTERRMASQFFEIAKGDWYLKYGDQRSSVRGQERLRIYPNGRYDIDKQGVGYIHTFNLVRVRFDPIAMHVSFDKVFSGVNDPANRPAGQIHSRELLDILPDKMTMVGYSERFRHPLIYRRTVESTDESQPKGLKIDLDNGHAVAIYLDRPDIFRLVELMDGRDIATVKVGDEVWFKSPARVVKVKYSDKAK